MQKALFVNENEVINKTPVVYKPVKRFEVSLRLKNFLTYLRLEIQKPDPYDGFLTEAQHKAIPKQRGLLIRKFIDNGVLPEYRKHVLSAMLGIYVESQTDLNWRTHSYILDALKQENDNGKMVLEEIQNGIIAHPSSLTSSLYEFLWECSDMPDM